MAPAPSYPLLPFSQLVYESTRWMPQVYKFPFTLVWKDGAKEKVRIEQAFCMAIANHPAFQMRTDWRGRQYPSPSQDVLNGQYHRMFFRIDGEDLVISGFLSRLVGDGFSLKVLMEDIRRAYEGKSLEPDDYWGYVDYIELQKQSQHYLNSREWLISEFTDESIPVRPLIDRHLWTLLPPKAALYTSDYTDLHEAVSLLAETECLSMDGFFSLCTALAIAEYCGTESAALTWAYEGRERPEEQRIFGSLHRDIPFKINRTSKIGNQKSDLIRQARNQIRSGIAHSDYPYTLTAPYNKRWNYAVNVLRIMDMEDILKDTSLPIENVPVPDMKYAYALLDVEIHESMERLSIVYRYSATHYKPESIRRFAALVRKYAEWLLEK